MVVNISGLRELLHLNICWKAKIVVPLQWSRPLGISASIYIWVYTFIAKAPEGDIAKASHKNGPTQDFHDYLSSISTIYQILNFTRITLMLIGKCYTPCNHYEIVPGITVGKIYHSKSNIPQFISSTFRPGTQVGMDSKNAIFKKIYNIGYVQLRRT